ncbi:LOW QUALITY PROTEIN: uncharacterized protein LOC110177928 [Drosophila serrata]|uniref:LOW QUALITY PROTEIN: uncharacterized protein LOC110177928 n=1 Tax=Drosophila serrata TaxID=7274 RepID=UPI000A1D29C3|nr:LOW QUALITY PROTEIN: uncharacterized protein LOC110177928 [Drosophila serrata]
MWLMRRTLLRAQGAATRQQLRCMESRRNLSSCGDGGCKLPAPKKDVQKAGKSGNPDNASEKDHCWTANRRGDRKCRSDIEFKVPISFYDAQAKCGDPCAKAFPRRDVKLYKPSDKLKRIYQRTWCECELKQRKRKAVCKSRPIVYERRIRTKVKAKCPPGNMELGLGQCHHKASSPCPRVTSPLCKEANILGCFPENRPSGCVKRRTKYPSYSECLTDPLPDLPPSECFCLKSPPMCVVWNYFRMKKS